MAIDLDGASASAPPAGSLVAPDRPAPPDAGLGRWMRGLCGVREDILDWVPEERSRYTGFGIIVLNTGFLAALAMFTALTKIVAAPPVTLVPVALLWGWIILSIDRWLIASTHGVHKASRLPLIFAPRFVLAVLLALSIAEPLTLRIFQPALDREVQATRSAQLSAYQSKLQSCNPSSGVPISSPTCDGYRLSIKDPATSSQSELSNDQAQRAQLQSEVNTIQQELSKLRGTAQQECAGVNGSGLSGLAGVGWRCTKDWGAVTSYQDSSGLAGRLVELQSLNDAISTLNVQAGAAQQTSANQVNAAITAAVEARKQTQQGVIGLLDEWSALERLSAQSSFVNAGHWLLWLLLIALDCLPVMAKIMSGSTSYDRLVTNQIESAERIHDVDLQLREQDATADKEIAIQLTEMSKQDRLRRLDEEQRFGRAQREADVVTSAEELANRWIREAEQRDAERDARRDDGP